HALVVAAPETRGRVTAVGRLIGVDRPVIERLTVGTQFPPAGDPAVRVVAIGPIDPGSSSPGGSPEREASVVIECDRTHQPGTCAVAGINLMPNTAIRLPA